jgi:hypothetical protein
VEGFVFLRLLLLLLLLLPCCHSLMGRSFVKTRGWRGCRVDERYIDWTCCPRHTHTYTHGGCVCWGALFGARMVMTEQQCVGAVCSFMILHIKIKIQINGGVLPSMLFH